MKLIIANKNYSSWSLRAWLALRATGQSFTEEQILLGLTPGRITPLHVLKHPVSVAQTEPATPEFAQRLMELLGKDQKDKS